MRARTIIGMLCASMGLALAGCAGSQPNPTAAPPPIPPGGGAPYFSDEQVAQARQLYVVKCTRCHKFYPPERYSESDWEQWMRKMSRKARLMEPEEQLLREYLSLFRR